MDGYCKLNEKARVASREIQQLESRGCEETEDKCYKETQNISNCVHMHCIIIVVHNPRNVIFITLHYYYR
jgi:hypothetical protein